MSGKLLWAWDDTNKTWVKLQVTPAGYIKVDMSAINLNDLGDVNVPAPADHDIIDWDAASSKWVKRSLGDMGAHAARHNWLGADEADYWQALLTTHRLCIFDGQAPDMWTSHTDGVFGSVVFGLLKTVLATGADLTGYAHLQTTAAGHAFNDASVGNYIKWIIRFENATSHADETAWVWVSKTNGATLPNSGQRYAGFKLIATASNTFRVYACSANAGGGANEEITDTGIDIVGMWSPDINLVIKPTGAGHAFYVNDVLAATHSTYVPNQGDMYCHQRIGVSSNNNRTMRLINICFME